MSAPVAPRLRYKRDNPCSICGGWEGAPRGTGTRCYGFRSGDGEWARCTREEHAGNLAMEQSSEAYVHRLTGDCNCGARHDPAPPVRANGKREPRPTIEAEYNYTDEDGSLLYQALRYVPKTFKQRRPDGNGGWIWNVAGARPVPYNLPDLCDTTRDDRTVFIVEGEKDADRLATLGLIATTNVGGSGKWRGELNVYFVDRNIVILPDNDAPGRKHAEQVAAALYGVAASVRIVSLPGLKDKGDTADWLGAGGRLRDLRALVEQTPAWEPTPDIEPAESIGPSLVITSLADVQSRDIDWLWPRWLARGKLHIIGGHAGDGKSTLTAWLSSRFSRGGVMPDGASVPVARVLFLLAEDAVDDTLKPRLEQHGADHTSIYALEAVREIDDRETPFNLSRHLPLLRDAIRAYRIDVVIVDPLSSFLSGTRRNDEGDVRDVLTPLAQLATETQAAFIGIMHLVKSGNDRRPLHQLMSSGAFGAVARLVWMVAPVPEEPDRRVVAVVKSNVGVKPAALEWSRPEDKPIAWHGESTHNIDELLSASSPRSRTPERERIIELLTEHGEALGPAEVAARLDLKHGSVRNMMPKMADAGDIIAVAYGKYSVSGHELSSLPDTNDSDSDDTWLPNGHSPAEVSSLSSLSLSLRNDTSESEPLACVECGATLYTSQPGGRCQRCRERIAS